MVTLQETEFMQIPCFVCFTKDKLEANRCNPVTCETLTSWLTPKTTFKRWTEKEIEILIEKWSEGYTAKQISSLFLPNRTRYTIYTKAHQLVKQKRLRNHTTKKPKYTFNNFWWSEEELERLANCINKNLTYQEMLPLFPNRTLVSLSQQVVLLRKTRKIAKANYVKPGKSPMREHSIKVTFPKLVYNIICAEAETTNKSKSAVVREYILKTLEGNG